MPRVRDRHPVLGPFEPLCRHIMTEAGPPEAPTATSVQEEELPVLGQRPEIVGHERLELVRDFA